MTKKNTAPALYEVIDRSSGKEVRYAVVVVDDIQWGIRKGRDVVSYHMFSDSLARVWNQKTGTQLPLKLPRKRSDEVQEERPNGI